jgi:small membrane protein
MKLIQVLFLPFVLFALVKMIYTYKQGGMQHVKFLFWSLVWIGTALIITFPDSTSLLAHQLGIGRGADLIMYVALMLAFYLIFRIQLTLDRLEQEITEIVRSMALERQTEPKEPRSGS